MSKNCKKKRTSKDRTIAERNTLRRKALKAYRTYVRSDFKDYSAFAALQTATTKLGYHDTVDWCMKVRPEG